MFEKIKTNAGEAVLVWVLQKAWSQMKGSFIGVSSRAGEWGKDSCAGGSGLQMGPSWPHLSSVLDSMGPFPKMLSPCLRTTWRKMICPEKENGSTDFHLPVVTGVLTGHHSCTPYFPCYSVKHWMYSLEPFLDVLVSALGGDNAI